MKPFFIFQIWLLTLFYFSDLVTYAVTKVLIPGHEDDQEADHEARHGHGEGSQRSKGEIFGQEVGQNSGYDG